MIGVSECFCLCVFVSMSVSMCVSVCICSSPSERSRLFRLHVSPLWSVWLILLFITLSPFRSLSVFLPVSRSVCLYICLFSCLPVWFVACLRLLCLHACLPVWLACLSGFRQTNSPPPAALGPGR